MLIYKQRYKPRTTREFTKSDLTVYDSAGNTALNALTVYGKSEVVNNEIVSAGEGWATVDLGTLNWEYDSNYARFTASLQGMKDGLTCTIKVLCNKYQTIADSRPIGEIPNKAIYNIATGGGLQDICIYDTDYTNVTAFKTSMSGVILVYPLADTTQGNTIAIKTDDGTGIDGTMATFSTGTPLYGVSDTVRDVITWDGSAGVVTKNCAKSKLSDYKWTYNSSASTSEYTAFSANTPLMKMPINRNVPINLLTPNFNSIAQDAPMTIFTINALVQFTRILIRVPTTITTVEQLIQTYGNETIIYELATTTTQSLTSTENDSIAGLRTFEPQTHAQNNAQTEMTVDYTIRVPAI